VLYFADSQWWEWHHEKKEYKGFAGQRCTIENTGRLVQEIDVHMLHNYGVDGLSLAPNGVHTGSNSGYQAVNLAVLAGAKRILLLGYDMKFQGARTHWHGGHPIRTASPSTYKGFASRFHSLVEPLSRLGVEVINCTPGSALDAFPGGDAKEILGCG
jgi:hypothetical protein